MSVISLKARPMPGFFYCFESLPGYILCRKYDRTGGVLSKRLPILCLLLLVGTAPLIAQSLPAAKTIGDFWTKGEKKTYQFVFGGLDTGRLEATLDDIIKEGGSTRFEINEKLTLDSIPQIMPGPLVVEGKLTVDALGRFLSVDYRIRAAGGEEELHAVYNAGAGTVTIGRGDDGRAEQTIEVSGPVFIFDPYMLDQLELALAMNTLSREGRFALKLLSPQRMFAAEYEFSVPGRVQVRYGAFADSVWQVNMISPAQSTVYVDRKHRLVKFLESDQKLEAETLYDPFAARKAGSKGIFGWVNNQMSRLPIYGFYALISLACLIFLARDSYRLRWSYVLLILGGIAYQFIFITQVPLQEFYALKVLAPALAMGQSIFIGAIVPALLTGLIQQALKLVPLLIAMRLPKIKPMAFISLGAFVGAGFGFVEACQIAGPVFQSRTMTSFTLVERIFTVLFHTTTGALMGYGVAQRKIWQYWLASSGLHALSSYLIVFVQMRLATVKTLQTIIAVYDFILVAGMVFLQRTYKKSQLAGKRART